MPAGIEGIYQFGFAAVVTVLLLYIIHIKMDRIAQLLSEIQNCLSEIAGQQEGGYKIVIDQLLQQLERKHNETR